MVTIELEKNEVLQKTHFQDAQELLAYLQEYFLVEKLHKMDWEESSWPMDYEDSVKFLKNL